MLYMLDSKNMIHDESKIRNIKYQGDSACQNGTHSYLFYDV